MNEAETRAELIDPKLTQAGWTSENECKIYREHRITLARVGSHNLQGISADYVLSYKNVKLAVIEAKKSSLPASEGVAQAKLYAEKLALRYAITTNGLDIYLIDMETGQEQEIEEFPTPQQLFNNIFEKEDEWRDKFNGIAFENLGGTKPPRYYQEIAVNNVMEAISQKQNRILLTLATGTGKTFIAFQIAWKLFHSRWNLKFDGSRRPRILFLADRNILANQAFNDFSAFPEDALVRINPKEISKQGRVPTNGSIFFTIFQTFMTGPNKDKPNFGQYPPDYFDFIIIDECHRGGANDESNWRGILEYFSPAYQLGLTATPKRDVNTDTYKYFGKPVYIYSLKEGINDGYLTPFKVRRIQTTLDSYIYTKDDQVLDGEIEEGREYVEEDFNKVIEIKSREKKRVELFMEEINQKEKTLVFCASQEHAAAVRDLINQIKKDKDPNYCVRVTANDGEIGNKFLSDFRDNEKTIPTILTTSHKLSTGVDARNVRNIVLMRSIGSMIEFKQIIGRGTRIFENKNYFTIYDFVGAYKNFLDPEWDGEPVDPVLVVTEQQDGYGEGNNGEKEGEGGGSPRPRKIKVKLADGKEREIQSMKATMFIDRDGKFISSDEFMRNLFGELPNFFKNEQELRDIWGNPDTRKEFLTKLEQAGYGRRMLDTLKGMIDAEKSDLFDVLEYVAYAVKPITREIRAAKAKNRILDSVDDRQKAFLEFVLSKYVDFGIDELDREKLPDLITLKYKTLKDGLDVLGDIDKVAETFVNFQKELYV